MFFGFSAPKIEGVLMKTFSKGSFTPLVKKTAPGGGAFYQIPPDVALTTCIQLYPNNYPKSKFWDSRSMIFGFSASKVGWVLMRTFSKGSFTGFFQKIAPRGGGRFTRFQQTRP